LRDTIEKLKASKEDQEGEVFGLQIENQTLRERLEVVETILKSNKEEFEN
jgi:regulator of replication initiation timing